MNPRVVIVLILAVAVVAVVVFLARHDDRLRSKRHLVREMRAAKACINDIGVATEAQLQIQPGDLHALNTQRQIAAYQRGDYQKKGPTQ